MSFPNHSRNMIRTDSRPRSAYREPADSRKPHLGRCLAVHEGICRSDLLKTLARSLRPHPEDWKAKSCLTNAFVQSADMTERISESLPRYMHNRQSINGIRGLQHPDLDSVRHNPQLLIRLCDQCRAQISCTSAGSSTIHVHRE
jgi:protein-tyrosine-phosphatase